MKITVFKPKGTKETVTRVELVKVVEDIARGEYVNEVHRLREVYPLIHPKKEADGRMRREYKMKLELPRICFAMEMQQLKGERKSLAYNGLLVLEANNLSDYDEAIQIRDAAARTESDVDRHRHRTEREDSVPRGAVPRCYSSLARQGGGSLFADKRGGDQAFPP